MAIDEAEVVPQPPGSDLFAVMEGGKARLFSLSKRAQVAEFQTVHSGGGHAVALVGGSEPVLVAAAWVEQGVAGYEALTGRLLWQRTDLKHVHYVTSFGGEPGREAVGIAREDGMGWTLNVRSGKSLAPLKGVRQLYGDPARHLFVTVEPTVITLRSAATWSALSLPPRFKQTGRGLSLLAAAFTDSAVVFARTADDFGVARLEAFTHDGGKLWGFTPRPRSHVIRLASAGDGFVAVEWGLDDAKDALLRLDTNGKLLERRELEAVGPEAFLEGGKLLVTRDGRVLDTATLEQRWSFGAVGGA